MVKAVVWILIICFSTLVIYICCSLHMICFVLTTCIIYISTCSFHIIPTNPSTFFCSSLIYTNVFDLIESPCFTLYAYNFLASTNPSILYASSCYVFYFVLHFSFLFFYSCTLLDREGVMVHCTHPVYCLLLFTHIHIHSVYTSSHTLSSSGDGVMVHCVHISTIFSFLFLFFPFVYTYISFLSKLTNLKLYIDTLSRPLLVHSKHGTF